MLFGKPAIASHNCRLRPSILGNHLAIGLQPVACSMGLFCHCAGPLIILASLGYPPGIYGFDSTVAGSAGVRHSFRLVRRLAQNC